MPQYRPEDPTHGWIIPEALKAFLSEEQADVADPHARPQADCSKTADGLRKMAKDGMLFVSQHEFFCYLIKNIGYADITPDPENPNR